MVQNETVKKTKATKEPEISKEELADIIDTDTDTVKLDFNKASGEIKIGDSVRVLVKSLVFGKLIIKLNDGGTYEFNRAGETHEMSMKELRELKASQLSFFKNQWLLILGVSTSNTATCEATPADIYKSVGVDNFYRNYIDPTSFRDICSLKPGEIEMRTKLLCTQAKDNLLVALKSYIDKGALSDLNLIKAWEKNLGCELLNKR